MPKKKRRKGGREVKEVKEGRKKGRKISRFFFPCFLGSIQRAHPLSSYRNTPQGIRMGRAVSPTPL
jgi:hypothetical protein